MKEIEEVDKIIIEDLLKLKKINKQQVYTLQTIMRKVVDGTTMICGTCPSQVRFAHQRLEKWYKNYKKKIKEKKEDERKSKSNVNTDTGEERD